MIGALIFFFVIGVIGIAGFVVEFIVWEYKRRKKDK